jgi:hypothetical protein
LAELRIAQALSRGILCVSVRDLPAPLKLSGADGVVLGNLPYGVPLAICGEDSSTVVVGVADPSCAGRAVRWLGERMKAEVRVVHVPESELIDLCLRGGVPQTVHGLTRSTEDSFITHAWNEMDELLSWNSFQTLLREAAISGATHIEMWFDQQDWVICMSRPGQPVSVRLWRPESGQRLASQICRYARLDRSSGVPCGESTWGYCYDNRPWDMRVQMLGTLEAPRLGIQIQSPAMQGDAFAMAASRAILDRLGAVSGIALVVGPPRSGCSTRLCQMAVAAAQAGEAVAYVTAWSDALQIPENVSVRHIVDEGDGTVGAQLRFLSLKHVQVLVIDRLRADMLHTVLDLVDAGIRVVAGVTAPDVAVAVALLGSDQAAELRLVSRLRGAITQRLVRVRWKLRDPNNPGNPSTVAAAAEVSGAEAGWKAIGGIELLQHVAFDFDDAGGWPLSPRLSNVPDIDSLWRQAADLVEQGRASWHDVELGLGRGSLAHDLSAPVFPDVGTDAPPHAGADVFDAGVPFRDDAAKRALARIEAAVRGSEARFSDPSESDLASHEVRRGIRRRRGASGFQVGRLVLKHGLHRFHRTDVSGSTYVHSGMKMEERILWSLYLNLKESDTIVSALFRVSYLIHLPRPRLACWHFGRAIEQRVMHCVLEQYESGLSLDEALARHPRIFSTLAVNFVHVGLCGYGLSQAIGQFLELAAWRRRCIPHWLAASRHRSTKVYMRTVGTLAQMGVPLDDALRCAGLVLNRHMQLLLERWITVGTLADGLPERGVMELSEGLAPSFFEFLRELQSDPDPVQTLMRESCGPE